MTEIASNAFKNNANLANLNGGANIEIIGASAFENCTNLKYVSIGGATLRQIGQKAFYNCSTLKSVYLGSTLESIADFAFYGCEKLQGVVLPSNLTSIGQFAFYDCASITSVTLPESMEIVGASAFRRCSTLGQVRINSRSVTVGGGAFAYCGNLKKIYMPTSALTVNDNMFYGCGNIEAIMVPNTLNVYNEYILQFVTLRSKVLCETEGLTYQLLDDGTYSVVGCDTSVIGELIIPETYNGKAITKINTNAFFGCGDITLISVPFNVTVIEANAFSGCTSLQCVIISRLASMGITNVNLSAFNNTALVRIDVWDEDSYWAYAESFAENEFLLSCLVGTSFI